MTSLKTEETVAKFNEGQDDEWEIVENYHEMSSCHYLNRVITDLPREKPCKHAIDVTTKKEWRRLIKGDEHVVEFIRWTVPRVVKKYSDGHSCWTTICLDCLLEKVTEHYG